MNKITALIISSEIFGQQNYYDIFFCYTFNNFWFNAIIYFTSSFTVFFIIFIFVSSAQVTHTNISLTWRIIVTIRILISITNLVSLIFKWWRFFGLFLYIRYTILFCPFTLVVWYLNTSFTFYRSFQSIFSFILARNALFIWWFTRYTCSMSRQNRRTWIVFANIYLFGVLFFGAFIRKTDWWNRPLFSFFTLSYVSVPLVDLDLSNDPDLSDGLLLSDLLLMD